MASTLARDGVHWRCVILRSRIKLPIDASEITSRFRSFDWFCWTTVVYPLVSVHNNSSTDMSNETLVTASHLPRASAPRQGSSALKQLATLWWSIITPLGRPVEPEV